MADNLTPQCFGRTIKVDSSCGCTLTRPNIDGLTPQDIINLGSKEIYLTKAILSAKEAEFLGVPESSLSTFINSSIKNIKPQLNVIKIDEQSVILPYIYRRQREVVNNNTWSLVSGAPHPNAGVDPVPANAYQLVLSLGNSTWQTNLEAIERYFTPGSTVIVHTWDHWTTQSARTLEFTVLSAVNDDVGPTKRALVTVVPPINSTDWAGMSPSEKSVWQPTFGVVMNGTNATSNYESYCPQQPSENSIHLIVNWLQTSRESYCRESPYEETTKLILEGKVNDYLKGFVNISIEEQQRQQKKLFERERLNSFFFGEAIDINKQTPETYKELPVVNGIVDTNCPLEYKAKALGIFTQLLQCNRVKDLQGQTLDLDEIFEDLYVLWRNREASGDKIDVIDSMTGRITYGDINDTMVRYYKARYGWETVRYAKIGEKITHEGFLLFNYSIYDVPNNSFQWAVFAEKFFDDLRDSFNTRVVGHDFTPRGNYLLFLDWSDIKKGVAGTAQATRKSPNPNTDLPEWQCVITPTYKTYDLRSETWTAMMDRPSRHLGYYNFANGCLRVAAPIGCTVPQS